MSIITFDWSQIAYVTSGYPMIHFFNISESSYIGSPLATPCLCYPVLCGFRHLSEVLRVGRSQHFCWIRILFLYVINLVSVTIFFSEVRVRVPHACTSCEKSLTEYDLFLRYVTVVHECVVWVVYAVRWCYNSCGWLTSCIAVLPGFLRGRLTTTN